MLPLCRELRASQDFMASPDKEQLDLDLSTLGYLRNNVFARGTSYGGYLSAARDGHTTAREVRSTLDSADLTREEADHIAGERLVPALAALMQPLVLSEYSMLSSLNEATYDMAR